MADARSELEELRRLDELERRAAPKIMPSAERDVGAPPQGISIDAWRNFDPAQRAQMRKPGWGGGVPQFAYDVGGTVTDKTGSPAAGYAANVASQSLPALLSSFRIPGAQEQSLLQRPAEALMKKAIKPSTAEDPAKVAAALRTSLEEGLNPSYGGMEKKAALATALNPSIENAVARSGGTVDTHGIADAAQNAYGSFKNGPKALSAVDDLGGVQETFLNLPEVAGNREIPVQLAHRLKQGYQKSIGDKGYDQLRTPETEGEKQIARALREAVAKASPKAAEGLSRQSELNNWERIVGNAAGRESNKDLLGISAVAGSPEAMLASSVDRLGIAKALAARTMYTAGKPSVALPIGIAADEKLQTDRQRMAEYLRQFKAQQADQR